MPFRLFYNIVLPPILLTALVDLNQGMPGVIMGKLVLSQQILQVLGIIELPGKKIGIVVKFLRLGYVI